MMKLIYFGGQKGGGGKTTTTHLFCIGATLAHQPAAYVLTDPARVLKPEGRPYGVFDGTDPDKLAAYLDSSRIGGNGWLAIDGGGNRQAFDDAMAKLCDLSIICLNDDQESLDAAKADLARMERSFALPTRWPSNSKAQDASAHYVAELAKNFPGRVVSELSVAVHSTNELNKTELGNPSSPTRILARKVFAIVSDLHEQHGRKMQAA